MLPSSGDKDMSAERFDRIDSNKMSRIDGEVDRLCQRLDATNDCLLQILAAERDVLTGREFQEAMADLKETISRRIDPLEVVVRRHSADIAKLKRAR